MKRAKGTKKIIKTNDTGGTNGVVLRESARCQCFAPKLARIISVFRSALFAFFTFFATSTIFLLLFLFAPFAPFVPHGSAFADVADNAGQNARAPLKITIVSDAYTRFAETTPSLAALGEFLGRFDAEQRVILTDDWRPGALAGADVVVYFGLREATLPDALLTEIASAPRAIWIEANIEQLARRLGWNDFIFDGSKGGWENIRFRSRERVVPPWIRFFIARPGAGAEIFSTVGNMGTREPCAWRRDNVYYLAAADFYEPAMLSLLVDLLHRAIPSTYVLDVVPPKRALLRVEDVSPLVRAERLQAVIDTIESYGIPYAIAVISIGLTNREFLHLDDNPELLAVLQRAQANGASIVMHGYTHQNEYSPTTGEGWEFWNARDDKPMPDDENFARDRLEHAFSELARNGLYPVAFEPPHYAISKKDLEVLSQYFNVFSGMPQISDESYTITLTLPYVIRSPYMNGMILIPENMGYYDGSEMSAAQMLQSLHDLRDIDDAFAGFFYHGYISPDHLPKLIEGVQRQGYTFFDLRTLDIRAGSSQVRIVAEGGAISAVVDPELGKEWQTVRARTRDRALIEKVAWVEVGLLIVVVTIFIGLILRLRRNARKKYEVD